jgi:hypothetical protein
VREKKEYWKRKRGKGMRTYSHSTSYWQFNSLLVLCVQVPAFNSSQFIPTICREGGNKGQADAEREATRDRQKREKSALFVGFKLKEGRDVRGGRS